MRALLDAFASTPSHAAAADVAAAGPGPALRTLDPETYGGAVLLGVDGVCIISHGSSTARAMVNAIRVAREMVEADLVGQPPRRRGRRLTTWSAVHGPGQASGSIRRAVQPQEDLVPAETHVEQSPMDRDGGLRARPRPPGRHPGDRPGTISEGQSFADDLDADSLALIELVEALEEELGERTVGFRIEDEDLEDLKTVRDAVDYVYDRVK